MKSNRKNNVENPNGNNIKSREFILTFFFVYAIIYMKIEGGIKMNEEKWKFVEEYGNKYEVSNLGRVKSHHKKKPKILLINYNT